jgi:hypothetical protein
MVSMVDPIAYAVRARSRQLLSIYMVSQCAIQGGIELSLHLLSALS